MKKYRTKLLTLFMIAAWAVASITPPITPSATAEDHKGYKNKFLRKGCKAKDDHICETGGEDGIIVKIIDTIF